MKKYNCDVLFVVEHKSREVASYTKIGKLLQEKGIKSLIIQKTYYAYIIPFISPLVIIGNGFGNSAISNVILRKLFNNKSTFIIHHWEQLIAPYSETMLFKKADDFEKNECITLYWFDEFKEILNRNKFDISKSHFVNNPNLSILNAMNKNFDATKKKLIDEFSLENKKILFFPANFFWAFFYHKENPMNVKMHEWFKKQLEVAKEFIIDILNKDDIYIVFRPHPYEIEIDYRNNFGNYIFSHKNFKYTNEYTVKEWTLLSDYIVSNFSTTAYDAHIFGKKACFLNQNGYLDFYENDWLHEPTNIANYSEFISFRDNIQANIFEKNKIDFHYRFSEIIRENLTHKKNFPSTGIRIKMLFKIEVFKTFVRSILCKYFNGYKINESIKPDYFEPIILKPIK